MCGGFTCTKNSLKALNLLYIVVSFILLSVACYGKASIQISDVSVIGGILACGIFLFLLSLLGLIATAKHHQVLLFFYMLILFGLFLFQFGLALACLLFKVERLQEVSKNGWDGASFEQRMKVQEFFNCCGFLAGDPKNDLICPNVACCTVNECRDCADCETMLTQSIHDALSVSGWIIMFFSFTEFVGVWLTVRYRNQKNPRSTMNAFL